MAVDFSDVWIRRLQKDWATDTLNFVCANTSTFDDSNFDLTLSKDMLQHWPTHEIVDWLGKPHARMVLMTNDFVENNNLNGNIPYDSVRFLDFRLPPFSLDTELVFEYQRSNFRKGTFLWIPPNHRKHG